MKTEIIGNFVLYGGLSLSLLSGLCGIMFTVRDKDKASEIALYTLISGLVVAIFGVVILAANAWAYIEAMREILKP